MDIFDSMYSYDAADDFGEFSVFKGQLIHGKNEIVAVLPKTGGDGFDCQVWLEALPAKFWLIKALPTSDSCNGSRPGFTIRFGSGMIELVKSILTAIREGMMECESVIK